MLSGCRLTYGGECRAYAGRWLSHRQFVFGRIEAAWFLDFCGFCRMQGGTLWPFQARLPVVSRSVSILEERHVTLPVRQPGGTLFVHSHPEGRTALPE